ncbi:hypothetical protein J2785_003106 [Burkholderia ambifaria]|nr:hypothetical protein [Burkholderia ambifaria]
MGWSGPGRQRHRAARMRVGRACGGGTSLPGWLESACAFVRSARLRDGSVRLIGRGDRCWWSRWLGRGVRAHATRRDAADGSVRFRTRASLTIAKSIAIDQLNVAMPSIRFPTTRRRVRCAAKRRGAAVCVSGKSWRSGVTRTIARTLGMRRIRLRQHGLHARAAIHPVTQIEDGQCARGREALRPGREPLSGWNRQTCRTESA